jgi:hypothetical protein
MQSGDTLEGTSAESAAANALQSLLGDSVVGSLPGAALTSRVRAPVHNL